MNERKNHQQTRPKNAYNGIGNINTTRSVSALITVSVWNRRLWSMQVGFNDGFHRPAIGVQILILMIMTGK
jgi:hypothetical protein